MDKKTLERMRNLGFMSHCFGGSIECGYACVIIMQECYTQRPMGLVFGQSHLDV